MRRTVAARSASVAAVALLALAACSGELPTTAEPQAGLSVSVQAEQDVDRILVRAQPGATGAEIVAGFLRANEGFDGENDAARTYLTSDLASRWVPTTGVLVSDGSPVVTQVSGEQVSVEVRVVGRIDAQGRLTEQAPQSITETFQLTQVDGQWRIREFPEGFGVWLPRNDLERAFQPITLTYLNTQGGYFVPEVRWLADGEGLPTAVTRAQLAPLPDHLDGAVRTAAVDGVGLASPAVPVDDSRLATVDLQGSALAQDESIATDLQSQLARALLGLPTVAAVEVQMSGQPLSFAGEQGPITAMTDLPYADWQRDVEFALLRVGEELIPVDPTQFRLPDLEPGVTEGVDLPEIGLSWTGVAVTGDLEDIAAVNLDGSSFRRWRGGETHTNEGIGDALTAPAVDTQGAFWLAGIHRSSETPRVWVVELGDLDAVARPVEAPWLRDDERVHALSVSPDGSRMLLLLSEGEEEEDHRAVLSGIVRDANGEPTGLAAPIDIAPSLVDVDVARWSSIGDVVLAGRRATDPVPLVFDLRLGQWLEPLDELVGVVDVVPVARSAGGARLIARTDDGGIFYPESQSSWFPARNGDALIVPGG